MLHLRLLLRLSSQALPTPHLETILPKASMLVMPAGEQRLVKKYSDDDFYDGKGNLGAALNPDSPLAQAPSFREAQLAQDAIRETGVGAEKLPFNPVLRMLQSNNPLVRGLAAQMVDMGGVIQKRSMTRSLWIKASRPCSAPTTCSLCLQQSGNRCSVSCV